jgi:hypothetical protein
LNCSRFLLLRLFGLLASLGVFSLSIT